MKYISIIIALLITSCGDSSNKTSLASVQSIQINWNDNSDNEEEFIISRRYSDDEYFTIIDYLQADETAYVDADIDSEYDYCYIVSASNKYGKSDSKEVCTK